MWERVKFWKANARLGTYAYRQTIIHTGCECCPCGRKQAESQASVWNWHAGCHLVREPRRHDLCFLVYQSLSLTSSRTGSRLKSWCGDLPFLPGKGTVFPCWWWRRQGPWRKEGNAVFPFFKDRSSQSVWLSRFQKAMAFELGVLLTTAPTRQRNWTALIFLQYHVCLPMDNPLAIPTCYRWKRPLI